MKDPVDTRVPRQVEREVNRIYLWLFPKGDPEFVARAFSWIESCFTGQYGDYQAIDARYHDLEHTLQGTLCLARLLEGRHYAKAVPVVPQKLFELAMVAILFHDTGYLKKKSDHEGTGAKYTATHVTRSIEFAGELLSGRGFGREDIVAVQNMIRCTGLQAHLKEIPFQSELERVLGYALATADLLGQMAAPDYIEKLPVLYQEFAEAIQFDKQKARGALFSTYSSSQDLMRQTPRFWSKYVKPKLQVDFRELYTFLNDPYPDGPNPYIQGVEQNLVRLEALLKS